MFQRVENKGKFSFHLGNKVCGSFQSGQKSAPRRCSRRGVGRGDYQSWAAATEWSRTAVLFARDAEEWTMKTAEMLRGSCLERLTYDGGDGFKAGAGKAATCIPGSLQKGSMAGFLDLFT